MAISHAPYVIRFWWSQRSVHNVKQHFVLVALRNGKRREVVVRISATKLSIVICIDLSRIWFSRGGFIVLWKSANFILTNIKPKSKIVNKFNSKKSVFHMIRPLTIKKYAILGGITAKWPVVKKSTAMNSPHTKKCAKIIRKNAQNVNLIINQIPGKSTIVSMN